MQKDRSKCPTPHRARYDEKSAKRAVSDMRRKGKFATAYLDTECGYWHIRSTLGVKYRKLG